MAADHCVGGVENSDKYRPISATCPVHAPSGLRLSVSKAAFSTGEKISFTLSQAQVSTNKDKVSVSEKKIYCTYCLDVIVFYMLLQNLQSQF